jgi:hypothetical protein
VLPEFEAERIRKRIERAHDKSTASARTRSGAANVHR